MAGQVGARPQPGSLRWTLQAPTMRTVRDVGPVQSRVALRHSTVSKGACPADCSGKLTHRSHMRTMGIP